MTAEEIESLKIIRLIAVEKLKEPHDTYGPRDNDYKARCTLALGITVLVRLIKESEEDLIESGIRSFRQEMP